MKAALQPLNRSASRDHPLPTGYDCGNGITKLVLGDIEIRCPSYFLSLHRDLYEVPANHQGGLVEYLDGCREDLIGCRWLAGFPAYQKAPTAYFRTVDDKRGKLKFGLQMLLGCLSTLPHRDRWTLFLATSVHDAKNFGAEFSALLAGNHTVRFNGHRQTSQVSITIDRVFEEGVGAIVTARSEIDLNGQTLLYDFGNGTCIVSVFGLKGALIERKVTPGGVEQLIDAIASHIDMRRQQSAEGDRQIIRAGIEDKTFRYGTSSWNFRSLYQTELVPWMQSAMAPALKAAAPWTPTSSAILAIGGGSELPTVRQLLIQKGIIPVVDGALAHVRGLYRLAQARLQEGGTWAQ